MALRNPLVVISGAMRELPASDTLAKVASLVGLNKSARADPKPYPVLYSWFGNVSDGSAPSAFDTEQAASSAPGGVAPNISSGRLIASGSGVRASYYRSPALGATVTRIGARFSLRPGTATRTNGGTAAIGITAQAIDISSGVNTNMSCHFRTTATSWAISVWTAGVGEVVLDSGTYSTALTVDSETEYEMRAWINGTTIKFDLPSGQRKTVTDSRVNTYAGQYAFFESYLPNGNTDDMAAFSHVWADTGTSIPAEPGWIHKSGAEDIFGYKAFLDGGFAQSLYIAGTVVLANGSPAVGKYLVSADGSGTATWQAFPRTNTTASSATPSINTDTTDEFTITALAAAITSMTTNLTGTPVNGQKLMIRIKDNGTARTITWGASFISSGVATLLATTVVNKTHRVGLVYDSTAAKWICMAVDAAGY